MKYISMEKKLLDYTLVPLGVVMLFVYHVWLLCRIARHPTKTVIGVNAIKRRFWVRAMMEDASKNGILAVQTLRNNIMASTLLATMAVFMLGAIIAVMMSNGSRDRLAGFLVYGDQSELVLAIKMFCIMVCFMVAFLLNVQSVKYYSHASIHINVPFNKMSPHHHHHHLVIEHVARYVNRGSYFWSGGSRAFYFSFPLLLWIFGPIPMFLCSLAMLVMLSFLDVLFEFGWTMGVSDFQHHTGMEAEDLMGTQDRA